MITRELKRGFMLSGNYTFNDFWWTKLTSLSSVWLMRMVLRFLEGPNNEVFDGSTHTHYLGAPVVRWQPVT